MPRLPTKSLRLHSYDSQLLATMKPAYSKLLALAAEAKLGRPWTMLEMAQQLAVPVGTVKSRLHRARAKLAALREKQDRENFTVASFKELS